MIHKWISIRTVITDVADTIPAQYFNDNQVTEWAASALEQINAIDAYEQDVHLTTILDYSATLPKGMLQIEQVALRKGCSTSLSAVDLDCLKDYKTEHDATTRLKIQSFLDSSYYQKNWVPLRLNKSAHFALRHCIPEYTSNTEKYYSEQGYNNDCPECEYSFSLKPGGCLISDCKEGIIAIIYRRWPMDVNGDFLIPNSPLLIEALRSFVMKRIWEARWNLKEEGSTERMQYYAAKWSTVKLAAMGELMMPSVDELENIRQARNRIIPVERRYYSFFGNLATSEHTLDF